MIEPAVPEYEDKRLESLLKLKILDTDREKRYDRIVQIASLIVGSEIALISLVDSHRQWFKASVGLGATETPRSISFCGHAIHENNILIVEDALNDERFFDNPLVTGDPNIRFYAGAPLKTSDGSNIGTLCVISKIPKNLNADQKIILENLSACVVDMMEHDKIQYDLSKGSEKSILLEEVLKTYLPSSTWKGVESSVHSGELVIKDERVDIVLLNLDIKGFTGYSENKKPEQVISTLNIYLDFIVCEIIEYKGEINKFVGDAVLAVFEDADSCIKAALKIQSLASKYNAENQGELLIRIGIHAGPVIRGTVGNYLRREQTLIGDVVNTSARLESVCPPGSVLVSDKVRQMTKDDFAWKKRYRLLLKGKNIEILAHLI